MPTRKNFYNRVKERQTEALERQEHYNATVSMETRQDYDAMRKIDMAHFFPNWGEKEELT